MLTRLRRRARPSTTTDSSIRRPICVTIWSRRSSRAGRRGARVGRVRACRGARHEPARPVDHDVGHGLVVHQRLDGPSRACRRSMIGRIALLRGIELDFGLGEQLLTPGRRAAPRTSRAAFRRRRRYPVFEDERLDLRLGGLDDERAVRRAAAPPPGPSMPPAPTGRATAGSAR